MNVRIDCCQPERIVVGNLLTAASVDLQRALDHLSSALKGCRCQHYCGTLDECNICPPSTRFEVNHPRAYELASRIEQLWTEVDSIAFELRVHVRSTDALKEMTLLAARQGGAR
jgi:hypothetical protein